MDEDSPKRKTLDEAEDLLWKKKAFKLLNK